MGRRQASRIRREYPITLGRLESNYRRMLAALDELKESFLEVIAKARAGLRLESGDLRSETTPMQASRAFERVSETQSVDETVSLAGTFKGVLLDSWEFNFSTSDGESIAGKINQELLEDEVIAFNTSYFNQPCVATLLKTTVSFKNGRNRVTYQLQNVGPPSAQ